MCARVTTWRRYCRCEQLMFRVYLISEVRGLQFLVKWHFSQTKSGNALISALQVCNFCPIALLPACNLQRLMCTLIETGSRTRSICFTSKGTSQSNAGTPTEKHSYLGWQSNDIIKQLFIGDFSIKLRFGAHLPACPLGNIVTRNFYNVHVCMSATCHG